MQPNPSLGQVRKTQEPMRVWAIAGGHAVPALEPAAAPSDGVARLVRFQIVGLGVRAPLPGRNDGLGAPPRAEGVAVIRPGRPSGRAAARPSRLPPEPGCGRGAGRPSRAGAGAGRGDPLGRNRYPGKMEFGTPEWWSWGAIREELGQGLASGEDNGRLGRLSQPSRPLPGCLALAGPQRAADPGRRAVACAH